MNDKRAIRLAVELQQIGVSQAGTADLLANYSHDVIERQLHFLPYRKATRKAPFIVDAIRNNYAAPKAFYHAQTATPSSDVDAQLDENSEPDLRPSTTEPKRHRTARSPRPAETDHWLESGGSEYYLEL